MFLHNIIITFSKILYSLFDHESGSHANFVMIFVRNYACCTRIKSQSVLSVSVMTRYVHTIFILFDGNGGLGVRNLYAKLCKTKFCRGRAKNATRADDIVKAICILARAFIKIISIRYCE